MIPQVCIGGSHIRTRFFTNCAFSHSPKLYYWCVRSSLQWRIDWRAEDRKRISFIWYWNCIGHWRRGTNRSGLFRKFNDHKIISWYAEKGTKNNCKKKKRLLIVILEETEITWGAFTSVNSTLAEFKFKCVLLPNRMWSRKTYKEPK